MVKQSRRQVKKRSLRRRTAKKRVMKRRAMKGGVYNDVGTYYRFKDILYELKSEKDQQGNMRYRLDFRNSNVEIPSFMGAETIMTKMFKNKYKEVFKAAFKVTSPPSKVLIDDIIDKLFNNGIAGVKRRQLEIIDMDNTFATIKLFENESEIDSVEFEKGSTNVKFEEYLKTLGDQIMPKSR